MRRYKVAVDFDGTIAEHRYPDIGKECPGAIKWMKQWQDAGAQLILWTMRSNNQAYGPTLDQAVEWCAKRGIVFDAVNEGLGDAVWTSSRKVYANVYVDDAAYGCHTVPDSNFARERVDWDVVGPGVLALIVGYNLVHNAAK